MLTNLDWLAPPPPDFRERLRALQAQLASAPGPDLLERLVSLATAALDETQLARLASLAGALGAERGAAAGFSCAKLAVIGDGTLSLLGPAISGSAVRHGLLIETIEGGYNSGVREATDRTSHLHRAGLDFALIACDARTLGLDQAAESAAAASAKIDFAVQQIRMMAEGLREAVRSAIFIQTVPPPLEPLFGSFDRRETTAPFAMVEQLNARIAEMAGNGELVLIDIARLAASVGLEHWHEPRHWHASKLTFSPRMIPVYADVVARALAAVRGKSRKCLVLDLDNTLWGGVIGDDGLAGIEVGQGSPTGEAHLAVQRLALELRARGVVLAVCSKNEDETARLPFREHPDMLLREDHIAVFQANWTDKAANLRAIAETLNIGIDALVFLDDNPAERAQVRRELPLVAVPELPDDPADYPRVLAAAGYFEAVSFAQEDRERADYYKANAERAALQLSASQDMEGYLASLAMECFIAPVDAVSRPRVAQLINKSNQFNLTTRRYTEREVQAAETDPARHLFQVRLTDQFGDNGIISVIVAAKDRGSWDIDTWLMSCRVLGRRVEDAVLAHLVAAASAEGAKSLTGRYIPSPKNQMVADHYHKLGFEQVGSESDGTTLWRLSFADYAPPELPMRIVDTAVPELQS
jgi:FkbH-like protein